MGNAHIGVRIDSFIHSETNDYLVTVHKTCLLVHNISKKATLPKLVSLNVS